MNFNENHKYYVLFSGTPCSNSIDVCINEYKPMSSVSVYVGLLTLKPGSGQQSVGKMLWTQQGVSLVGRGSLLQWPAVSLVNPQQAASTTVDHWTTGTGSAEQ